MRNGRVVARLDEVKGRNREIVRAMIGRDPERSPARKTAENAEPILRVENLTLRDPYDPDRVRVDRRQLRVARRRDPWLVWSRGRGPHRTGAGDLRRVAGRGRRLGAGCRARHPPRCAARGNRGRHWHAYRESQANGIDGRTERHLQHERSQYRRLSAGRCSSISAKSRNATAISLARSTCARSTLRRRSNPSAAAISKRCCWRDGSRPIRAC